MSNTLVYLVLFVVALAYAIFLNTKTGRNFTNEYTWASVIVGISLVLGAARFLISPDAWLKVALAFVVAGLPVIARSLVNKYKK